MRIRECIGIARAVLEGDPYVRERAAGQVTDRLGARTPARASTLAALPATAAVSKQSSAAPEAGLHALVEPTSTGHVGPDALSPLRETPLAGLPPQPQDHASDLLEG
ncbi:hypothetical protein ACIRPQ_07430 [Streptomyces sp. NPDC101213]|uniref:hypothetical protein n=1 Tax=Streptomyces sp. NPDC101213 TaxID=3366130 RepID=UPI00382C81F6